MILLLVPSLPKFVAAGLVRAVAISSPFVLLGCGDSQIEVYEVPKDQPTPANPSMTTSGVSTTPPIIPQGDGPTLTIPTAGATREPKLAVPAEWTEKAAGPMVKKAYAAGEASFTVTSFPGDVGGLMPNVNRWARQLGLPPVSESAVGDVTNSVLVAGITATRVDLSSDTSRTLVVLLPLDGKTWFFKLSGPAAAVDAATGPFDTMVSGITLDTP